MLFKREKQVPAYVKNCCAKHKITATMSERARTSTEFNNRMADYYKVHLTGNWEIDKGFMARGPLEDAIKINRNKPEKSDVWKALENIVDNGFMTDQMAIDIYAMVGRAGGYNQEFEAALKPYLAEHLQPLYCNNILSR